MDKIDHLNPEGLANNPAYSQGVAVSGHVRTIYVGGQNATDASGAIVGAGNIEQQTTQALKNVELVLKAGQAEIQHVVKWNIQLVQGQPLQEAFEAYRQFWADRAKPAAVTASVVVALARPEFLIEIDAIAVIFAS